VLLPPAAHACTQYLCVSVTGYAALGDDVPGSIVLGFAAAPAWVVILANLLVLIHMIPACERAGPCIVLARGQIEKNAAERLLSGCQLVALPAQTKSLVSPCLRLQRTCCCARSRSWTASSPSANGCCACCTGADAGRGPPRQEQVCLRPMSTQQPVT